MNQELKYEVKKLADIDNGKGYWNHTLVGVFLDGEKVGEYTRNYGEVGPFCPFEHDGKWLALYSPHYMYTRVMSLPDCRDLGGEDAENTPYEQHFCPLEYVVPSMYFRDNPSKDDPPPRLANHDSERWAKKVPFEMNGKTYEAFYWPDNQEGKGHTHLKDEYLAERSRSHAAYDEWGERHPYVTKDARWGLVSGCAWGDDHSVKVEFLDLTEAARGVLKREQRFGYLELGAGCGLEEGFRVVNEESDRADCERTSVEFAVPRRFRLKGAPL